MSISIKERRALERAAGRLIRAEIEESWSGARHPEEIPNIEAELKASKQAFRALLDKLSEPDVKR